MGGRRGRGGGFLDTLRLEMSGIGGNRGINLSCHKKPNEYRWEEGEGGGGEGGGEYPLSVKPL